MGWRLQHKDCTISSRILYRLEESAIQLRSYEQWCRTFVTRAGTWVYCLSLPRHKKMLPTPKKKKKEQKNCPPPLRRKNSFSLGGPPPPAPCYATAYEIHIMYTWELFLVPGRRGSADTASGSDVIRSGLLRDIDSVDCDKRKMEWNVKSNEALRGIICQEK